jgi:Fanconi anemia group J protein
MKVLISDGEQSRAVIAFGIPYPPMNDLEVRLKREYNDEVEGGMNGKEWYDAQAFRSLFQGTGRCIRHGRDYGAIILIDSRFAGHVDKFPRWMKSSVRCDVPINEICTELSGFYEEMNFRFPVKQILRLARPVEVSCMNCDGFVVLIDNVDDVGCSVLDSRPGLINFFDGCKGSDGMIFLKRSQQGSHTESVVFSEVE